MNRRQTGENNSSKHNGVIHTLTHTHTYTHTYAYTHAYALHTHTRMGGPPGDRAPVSRMPYAVWHTGDNASNKHNDITYTHTHTHTYKHTHSHTHTHLTRTHQNGGHTGDNDSSQHNDVIHTNIHTHIHVHTPPYDLHTHTPYDSECEAYGG